MPNPAHPRLTPAEHRVFDLLAQLRSAKEIAWITGTSESTVRTDIRHLQEKFGTASLVELTVTAVRHEGCCLPEDREQASSK